MLIPKIDQIFKEENTEDDSIIVNVDENNCIDFRENYLDILEDDKERDKYIKYIEKIVRHSFEYRMYISTLKNEFNLTGCAFFKNLNLDDCKISLEFHHYPFTLYDIVNIILENRIIDHNDDPSVQEKFDKIFNPFSIAKETMMLHYKNKVGLVPLALTPHELYHSGNLFIPLTKNYVFGRYDLLDEDYNIDFGNYKYILEILNNKTEEILNGQNELNLEKLKIKKVYVNMKNTGLPHKVKVDKDEIQTA